MAAAAGESVGADQVYIKSIVPGSVAFLSDVHFPSTHMVDALRFEEMLRTDPGNLFIDASLDFGEVTCNQVCGTSEPEILGFRI